MLLYRQIPLSIELEVTNVIHGKQQVWILPRSSSPKSKYNKEKNKTLSEKDQVSGI